MSRLVLVHGFSQTSASWAPVVDRLGHDVVAPEVPAHLDLWGAADHLATQAGVGTWIGYSMGGRIALHVALAHPDVVTGLVLVSATAGIDDPAERDARRRADEELADRIETIGAEAFLDEWLAQPLLHGAPADRGSRSRNETALATSLRRAGTGTQEPLWARLSEIAVPALIVAGERDAKFVALAERLVAGISDAELVVLPAAGHTCHLERPDVFAAAVEDWLVRHPDSASPTASNPP